MSCCGWFCKLFWLPSIEDDPEYVEVLEWYERLTGADCKDADLVLTHARKTYEESDALCRMLDAKAEGLFRVAVHITALFTSGLVAGFLLRSRPTTPGEVALVLPGWLWVSYAAPLALSFVSMCLTMIIRKPTEWAEVLEVRELLEICGLSENKTDAQIRLAGALQCARRFRLLVASRKARLIEWTVWIIIASVCALAVCFYLTAYHVFG